MDRFWPRYHRSCTAESSSLYGPGNAAVTPLLQESYAYRVCTRAHFGSAHVHLWSVRMQVGAFGIACSLRARRIGSASAELPISLADRQARRSKVKVPLLRLHTTSLRASSLAMTQLASRTAVHRFIISRHMCCSFGHVMSGQPQRYLAPDTNVLVVFSSSHQQPLL